MNEELQNEYVDINAHDNYPSSDEHVTVPPMKVLPLKKICMTIGQLPTAYLETMTYYEMLLWFIAYLRDNIIPTVNNNGEALEEVQTIVMSLQNYINNFKDSIDQDVEDLETYINDYFENLDVQEEINNKLDEMYEDGTLESILLNYTQSFKVYNTYDEMISDLSDTVPTTNMKIRTLGYHSLNDGGQATYILLNSEPSSGYYITINSKYLLLIENDMLNVKQFGAYGDDNHDDSDSIETVINYINLGNKNKTLFFPKGTYKITQSFVLSEYVNIDSENAIIKPYTGDYTNNFIFLLNTNDGVTWNKAYAGGNEIKNISIRNENEIENIRSFCLGTNRTTFYNVINYHMYGFIKDCTTSYYLDQIRIIKCDCQYNKGTNYMIDKNGSGDGLLIEQCHFPSDLELTNQNAIKLNSCGGGSINDNINGHIYLSACNNVSINDGHFEVGSITLKNSNVTINNCSIWKNDDYSPITIVDSEYEGNNAEFNVPIKTILNMIQIVLRYADYTYTTDLGDIDTSKCMQDLYINNCYRFAQAVGTGPTKRSFTGISIKNNSSVIINQYDKAIVRKGILGGQENVVFSNSLGTNSPSNLLNVGESADVPATLSTTTYYYRAVVLLDNVRLIRGPIANEKSVTKTNGTYSNILNLQVGHQPNIIVRLYRGTTTDSYDKYVDIPNVKNYRLYDDGITVNGFEWKNRTAGTIDTFESSSAYYKINKDPYSGTVVVGQGAAPTVGTWLRGDVVEDNSPSANDTYSWVCVTAGTPGTWKVLSTISS